MLLSSNDYFIIFITHKMKKIITLGLLLYSLFCQGQNEQMDKGKLEGRLLDSMNSSELIALKNVPDSIREKFKMVFLSNRTVRDYIFYNVKLKDTFFLSDLKSVKFFSIFNYSDNCLYGYCFLQEKNITYKYKYNSVTELYEIKKLPYKELNVGEGFLKKYFKNLTSKNIENTCLILEGMKNIDNEWGITSRYINSFHKMKKHPFLLRGRFSF
jgi:hypothetical protein